MKRWTAYAVASALVVAALVGLLRQVVDEAGRSGLLWAAGLALAVQWFAFGLMLVLRGRNQGFLLAMAGGTMARLGVFGAAGVVVTVVETEVSAKALLLGLAGFLFALALLEAVFLRGGEPMSQSG